MRKILVKTIISAMILCACIKVHGQGTEPYRVLIAYTTAAKGWLMDHTLGSVDQIINVTNAAYQNSNVGNVAADVVCVVHVNYTESGSWNTDLDNLTNGNIGNIDTLRNLYRADVCILLVFYSTGNTGGIAWIYPNAGTAFGVVHVAYAADDFAFPHEVGHLFGCEHDRYCGSGAGIFTYGHGYQDPSANHAWRTIMAYPCNGESTIPYFSNPNLNHPTTQQPLGTSTYENNARLLGERIDGTVDPGNCGAVATFRTTPSSMSLSSSTIPADESRKAIATSSIAIGDGFTVAQGAMFTAIIDPNAYGKKMGRNTPHKSTGPNVSLAIPEKTDFKIAGMGKNVQLNYSLREASDIVLRVFDAKGKNIYCISLGKREIGYYKEPVPLHLVSGQYFMDIRAGKYRVTKLLFNLH